MKKIAFFLPQFHIIPENNRWWGDGFTEWTNVKASRPQFKGHIQPEVPIDRDYYCLLDTDTQEKQSRLALEYGLDGFCYYHYWFDGKLLLEKPMENMLQNKKINIPFCICWANESWARTWDGEENKVLIRQNYDESEIGWKIHFDYLLRFFKDDRYIKDNNRPLIIVYKPQLIKKCRDMLICWDKLAKESGFNGVYVGCQHPSVYDYDFHDFGIDFGIEFEPLYSLREEKHCLQKNINKIVYGLKNPKWLMWKIKRKIMGCPNVHDYDLIWKRIVDRIPESNDTAAGAFPAWDNTPRRGQQADVFYKATPPKFAEYFKKRMENAKKYYGVDYLFINAWNEWAEGAHLEPDERNGYGYLEAIKNIN